MTEVFAFILGIAAGFALAVYLLEEHYHV